MGEPLDDLGQRVARLEEQMKPLTGNGQPGVIERMNRWEKWALKAIIVLLGSMLLTGSGTISVAKVIELWSGK